MPARIGINGCMVDNDGALVFQGEHLGYGNPGLGEDIPGRGTVHFYAALLLHLLAA